MSLQEQLKAMKIELQSKTDPETLAAMARAIEELKGSGLLKTTLGAGDRAPDFDLTDFRGERFSSVNFRKRGPLVVTFYRGVW